MRTTILLFSVVLPMIALSQKTITGKVFDATNNKPLLSASIVTSGKEGGVVSNEDGNFTLKINSVVKQITVSYVGYETRIVKIQNHPGDYLIGLQPALTAPQITVIGTRNASRTKLQSAVPVDVIQVAAMANQVGQTGLNQLLTYATPSFQSSRQTVADGTDHIDPAQLRGLGSDQILVLVNGKRRHQSALVNVNGTVNRGQVGTDLDAIPISAIDRVEVLRDGAAAQYGSDAIAGVINIILKSSTNNLTGNVLFGENVSSYEKDYAFNKLTNTTPNKTNVRDGANFLVGLNYGINLNNRGFINLTGEYSLREATNRTGTYTGAVYPNVGGLNKDDSILNARNLTRDDFDMRIGNSKISTGSFVLNAGYSLSDRWNVKVFGTYNQKNGEAAGFYRYPSGIPAAAAIYASPALALYPDGFLPLIKTNIGDYYLSAGLDGKLGQWNASLSNTIGINRINYTVDHSVNYSQFAVSAEPPTTFDAGGMQLLQNTINADFSRNFKWLYGLNIAYGAEFRIDQYAQHAGEEASYKNYNTSSGAAAGAQVFAGFVPDYAKKHSRSNLGAYLDLEQDFTKNWMLEFALRFENYSDFGNTLNYKLATTYKLGNNFLIRGAVSTGFRAPSMQQKYYSKTNTLFVSTPSGLQPTESGTFTNDSRPAEILGIPKLTEETSQNYSVGFTATPVRGLEISIDGYWININNRIILTNNFNGGTDTVLTKLLKDNGATTANFFANAIDTRSRGLEGVISYSANMGNAGRFRFLLSATFIKNEVRKGADGKPIINASEVLINSGQIGNYFNREDQSRIEVVSPSSKGNFMVNYNYRRFGAMLRFAYFGQAVYLDPTIDPSNPASFPLNTFTGQKQTLDQTFSPKTTTDFSLSYDLTRYFTLTVGATNIFDIYPDQQTHSGNVSLGRFIYSRRVEQMGYNGRFVFTRLSFNIP